MCLLALGRLSHTFSSRRCRRRLDSMKMYAQNKLLRTQVNEGNSSTRQSTIVGVCVSNFTFCFDFSLPSCELRRRWENSTWLRVEKLSVIACWPRPSSRLMHFSSLTKSFDFQHEEIFTARNFHSSTFSRRTTLGWLVNVLTVE